MYRKMLFSSNDPSVFRTETPFLLHHESIDGYVAYGILK